METAILVIVVVGALAAVMIPLVRGRTGPEVPADDASLEAEIARYREALRSGTVCGRCGRANDAGARYCTECGRALPAARRTPPQAAGPP